MSEQFKRVYLSAVWLLFLTTPLRDIIAQECKAFSIPLSPLYITFLGIFWLLWLGYTFGTIILFFSKMHSNPRLPSNQSECREVRIKCHIWTELELNSAVDSSLLGLINEIMSHHVLKWYSKISPDPAFSSEVQSLLQYLSRALILRLRHCDVTNLLKLKLIPCLLQHIHTSKLTPGAGTRHPALGAAARLPAYAAQAVSLLLRHVTPPHAHCSPLMASLLSQTVGNRVIARGVQKLSSPLFLYRLLYRLLDPDGPPVLPRFPSSPSVPLLRPLLPAPPPEAGSLENEELALFVRFLQSLGELPVLQCLLDLREVHEMLDGPKIHKHSSVAKLRTIRDTFFLSPDKFSLPLAPASLHSLQLILDTSIDNNDVIAKLQDSRVVGELLDQLTVARDRHLCHCFMRSGTFRLHSISRRFKDKSNTQVSKLEDRRGRGGSIRILRMNSPLISKKLAKAATIDVPSSDASVDRDIYRRTISDGAVQEPTRVPRSRSSGIENVIVSEDQMDFDLSRWQLTVPEVTRIKTHKTFHQFCLHAVRRDVTPENEWSIFRRYSEFEVLDSMLRKFFPNAKIGPVPRKILFISSQELETRRRELELYLTALLRVPELQQSELVCKFLCDINDDKIFQAENFGDHAGRMMRNIHKSILTDRHEFLSKPLDNFLESTAPPAYRHQSEVVSKVVSSRDKWLEDSREYSKVFDPPTEPPVPPVPPAPLGTPLSISSWGDLLQFVFNSVLTVPYPIRLLSAVLNLLLPYQTELWLQQSADQLIGQLGNESYLVFLIEKVRDTLYHSAPQVYNRDLLKSELVAQKLSLRERILSQIPKVAMHAIGEQLLLCNLEVVLECFENQENNQQLVSSLLDQIILELFPELT